MFTKSVRWSTLRLARELGSERTPEAFVYDGERHLVYHGAVDDNREEDQVRAYYLQDAIEAVLAGETPEVADTSLWVARSSGVAEGPTHLGDFPPGVTLLRVNGERQRARPSASGDCSGDGLARRRTRALRPHLWFRTLERSLVCACATPAASLPVAVQLRQHVAPLAGSPSLDELGVEPSPEDGSVALELVASGHRANGTVRL